MKRILAIAIMSMFAFGSALAADTFKYTFTPLTYSDGTTGTIRASVKSTRKSTVTVCEYSDLNDRYKGEYQTVDPNEFDARNATAEQVKQFCLQQYAERE